MDFFHQAQNEDTWRALVYTVMKPWALICMGILD